MIIRICWWYSKCVTAHYYFFLCHKFIINSCSWLRLNCWQNFWKRHFGISERNEVIMDDEYSLIKELDEVISDELISFVFAKFTYFFLEQIWMWNFTQMFKKLSKSTNNIYLMTRFISSKDSQISKSNNSGKPKFHIKFNKSEIKLN